MDESLHRRPVSTRQAVKGVGLGPDPLASVIDGLGAFLILLDPEFRIVWCNAPVREIYGNGLAGKRCHEVFYDRAKPCDECLVQRTIETGLGQSRTCWRDIPGAGEVHVRITTVPVFNSSGDVEQVLEFAIDLTQTGWLESQLAKYKQLADDSGDMVFITKYGEKGEILAVNRQLLDSLGYAEDELVGHSADKLSDVRSADAETQAARQAGLHKGLVPVVKKDGSLLPTRLFATHDPDACLLVCVLRDLSEKLRIDEETQRRAEESGKHYQRVVDLVRARDRVIRTASHELRTPLTAIVALSEILLDDKRDPLTEGQRSKLRKMASAANRMAKMLEDLLDVARIQAGKTPLRRSDIMPKPFLRRVCRGMAPLAAKKGLSLDIRVPADLPLLITDADKLRQIVANLVSNAIKYTEKGGVTISACQDGETVVIEVVDTGIGIPTDEQDRIFEEFYRTREGGTDEPGTGLGLSIARRLAELLGGTINVESRVGKGSRFTLRLPIKS